MPLSRSWSHVCSPVCYTTAFTAADTESDTTGQARFLYWMLLSGRRRGICCLEPIVDITLGVTGTPPYTSTPPPPPPLPPHFPCLLPISDVVLDNTYNPFYPSSHSYMLYHPPSSLHVSISQTITLYCSVTGSQNPPSHISCSCLNYCGLIFPCTTYWPRT